MYFFNANEEVMFRQLGGRLYLYVIHRDHAHHGLQPHAHVLDLSRVRFDATDVDLDNPASCRELNTLCGEAKRYGDVESWR